MGQRLSLTTLCGRRARLRQRAHLAACQTCQAARADGKQGYEVARLAAEAAQQAVMGFGLPYCEVAAVAFKAASEAAKENSLSHALLGIASEAAGKAAMASGASIPEASLCAGEVAAAEAMLKGSLPCFAAEQAGEAAAQAALAAGAAHQEATKLASQAAAKVASSAARADGVSADDAGEIAREAAKRAEHFALHLTPVSVLLTPGNEPESESQDPSQFTHSQQSRSDHDRDVGMPGAPEAWEGKGGPSVRPVAAARVKAVTAQNLYAKVWWLPLSPLQEKCMATLLGPPCGSDEAPLRPVTGTELQGVLCAGEVAQGLGVFAAKDFAAGELLCRVPPEALLIAGDGESLAQRYLQERSRADSDSFQAYWPSLPAKEELAPLHPLHWPPVLRRPEYVAELLRGSLAAQRTFQARLTGEVEESMLEALLVVDSRSFNITDEKGRVLRALVPFIDLVNSFVPLTSAANSWNCWFRGNLEEGAMLHAEHSIPRGTELVHCYGTFSSAELWATYGFLPLEAMESPDEAPLISVPLGSGGVQPDQLKQLKQKLEPRHWLDEQTLLFEIPWDLEDGPLDQVLELNWPGREAEVLAERLEVALQANQEAAKLQRAALQLLRNERPLLEEELAALQG
ncbi:unnamed protein product [Cladocopium goreaui]|uniref:Protein TIC 20-v, chloroplastic n=1 Tax=Cladocopium goreaui TaxID=2562237 RepID=A0A9P1BK94_9DINO|nr:unnamed protein product [Cladocopium goreaui]